MDFEVAIAIVKTLLTGKVLAWQYVKFFLKFYNASNALLCSPS